MGWLWNAAFGGGRNNNNHNNNNINKSNKNKRASMTKQTSVRMQQFTTAGKTGSLILSKEDLEAVQIQSKTERTRRKIEHQRKNHQDELQVMQNLKQMLIQQLDQKLETELDDISVYKQVIQEAFLEESLLLADPGDGMKEATLFQALHKSELKDKMRMLFQQQASDELMEIYRTLPKFQEQMGEREAKMVSLVFQKDALVQQRKELNETIVRIQKEMIQKLEKANQEQFQKRYEAIRDGNAAEDGDLVTRRQQFTEKSYSARILGASSPEKTTERKTPSSSSAAAAGIVVEGGLKDVILEEDSPKEAHIGEVKRRTGSSRSPMRPTTASRSRSPVPSTTGTGNTRRGEVGTFNNTTATTTTRVRARPAPPSARLAADRVQSGAAAAAARRAAGERARQQQANGPSAN